MRIGFDVDGVLANFCAAYERLFVEITGRNSFAPYGEEVGPISWNWPTEHYGYTEAETGLVWDRISNSQHFCTDLRTLPDASRLANAWPVCRKHDVYFITSRVGSFAKRATEDWLWYLLGVPTTVLIVKGELKGQVCAALKLDFFVEDNIDNAKGIAAAGILTYLVNRAYNQGDTPENILRVDNLVPVLETIEVPV